MKCFNCNEEISGYIYFKCLDNYMQANYFEYKDERDNIFCSKECFCEFLSLEEMESDDEEL